MCDSDQTESLCSDNENKKNIFRERSYKKKYKKSKSFVVEPITSYGLILFSMSKPDENEFHHSLSETDGSEKPVFLLYQRRDNFEYMDFLRGIWGSENQLPALFSLMSHEERERIRNYTFQELWDDLWVIQNCRIYREGFAKAKKKYDSIKNSIPVLLDKTTSCVKSPPWGFPKGKKNGYNEDPVRCAIREFEEETKITISTDVKIIQDIPFTEIFKGSNGKSYSTQYYLAEIPKPIYTQPHSTPNCIRKSTISEEASNIGWFTFEECKMYLNPRRYSILRGVMETIEQQRKK